MTYQGPFFLPVDEDGAEVSARLILDDGRQGAYKQARFARTRLLPPVALPWRARVQGLEVAAYAGGFATVDDIESGEPLEARGWWEDGEAIFPRVDLPEGAPATSFGLILRGFIRVPQKGIYTFYLSSDDGSRFSVGGQLVVNHDGPHSMSEASGQVALHRGWHPMEIRYFQGGGGKGLRLELEGPGLPRREVPAHWLAHAPSGGSPGAPRP
jgi:hexosaminidase